MTTSRRVEDHGVISGIGISGIGRRTGVPGIDLTMQAVGAAIADAGLRPTDIDAVATLGDTPPSEVSASLRLALPDVGRMSDPGALLSPVTSACVAIAEGRARHVLVYRTVLMRGGSMLGAERVHDDEAAAVMGDMAPLLAHHAYSAANWIAMHCRRHMLEYGTTKEQLGWLAVASREHAARNPLAVYRDPITIDDHLTARPVSTPLGLLDCDVPVDGSIAFVVSARDHATSCPSHPLRIAAIGGASGVGGWVHRPDYPRMAAADAAQDLWSRTDLRPADIDVAQLYDGFTFLALSWLEALGLCEEGGAGPFVEGGHRIALDGELPLNTYGGQLSAGRLHGYWVLHEACVQLRRDAGARQVPGDPEVAIVSTGGGPIAGCMLLTR